VNALKWDAMKLFKNKYRVGTCRPAWWDFNGSGNYCVTIVTKDRAKCFGVLENQKVKLSEAGEMVQQLWQQVPRQFPDVDLGEYIVMPDHFHGILTISNPNRADAEKVMLAGGGVTGRFNPMLHKGLGTVIRWFKGRATFELRKQNPSFAWQRNFYAHIILNNRAFERISRYIRDNPMHHGGL
jgi:putative transposase